MTEYKLTAELAEQEFDRMCVSMLIDTDMTGEDEETVKGFDDIKRKIVRSFMTGSLTLTDDGRPVYCTDAGKSMEFKNMTGAVLMSMDRVKKGEDTRKMFTVIGELTGGGVAPASLSMRDVKILFALVSLFLSM